MNVSIARYDSSVSKNKYSRQLNTRQQQENQIPQSDGTQDRSNGMEFGQDDVESDDIQIDEIIERLVVTFIMDFLQYDSINVMRQWCKYGPGNAPSPELCRYPRSLLPNQTNDIRKYPSPSLTEPAIRLLEIFAFASFDFGIHGDSIELFKEAPTLRLLRQSLCEKTQTYIQAMKKFNGEGEFFESTVRILFHEEKILSGFKKNELFQKYFDRVSILRCFFWVVMQFDKIHSFQDHYRQTYLHDEAQDISGYLYISIELFLLRHGIDHADLLFVQELSNLKKLLVPPNQVFNLYRYLSKWMNGVTTNRTETQTFTTAIQISPSFA